MTIDQLQYLSVGQAADEIGVTVGRIRQMLREGILSGKKLNDRAWIVDPDDVSRVRDTVHERGRPRNAKNLRDS